jgi:hypothetical protein
LSFAAERVDEAKPMAEQQFTDASTAPIWFHYRHRLGCEDADVSPSPILAVSRCEYRLGFSSSGSGPFFFGRNTKYAKHWL